MLVICVGYHLSILLFPFQKASPLSFCYLYPSFELLQLMIYAFPTVPPFSSLLALINFIAYHVQVPNVQLLFEVKQHHLLVYCYIFRIYSHTFLLCLKALESGHFFIGALKQASLNFLSSFHFICFVYEYSLLTSFIAGHSIFRVYNFLTLILYFGLPAIFCSGIFSASNVNIVI